MLKACGAALIILCLLGSLYANVVINELLYDPDGTDTGYEWLELYNNGNADIDLEGAQIQTAGSTFTTVFTFPHYILRAHRFVLIGEEFITQASFTAELAMQNGGSETDGVRFVSADGDYTDTVLYDSPNSNNLKDDTGSTGTTFAMDVTAGYSLERIADGLDTNNCESDFRDEIEPTPGLPNRVIIDYHLANTDETYYDGVFTFTTDICNYSTADDDTVTIVLEVALNGTTIQSFNIQPIAAGTTIPFTTPINLTTDSTGLLTVELLLFNDFYPADNIWSKQLGSIQPITIGINEFLYNPTTDNQEWIELYIPPFACEGNELTLSDAADNEIQFTLPTLCPQYLVLCRDQAALLQRYPECPADNVLQVSSLPSLNNEGDKLVLKDSFGTVLDSISYVGVNNKKDYSLERQIEADSTSSWHYCFAGAKGTPGLINSFAPPNPPLEQGHIKLTGSPFNPLANESMHLKYSFKDASNTINCYVYDLNGNRKHIIASDFEIGSTGELVWNGRDKHGKALPRGIYVLLVEVKNSSNHYFLRKQLTVVLATK